jgi:tetratricopeptide (TPR) repeat protein
MSVGKLTSETSVAGSRWRWGLVSALLCAAALAAGGWAWWSNQRYKSAMAEIETEILAHRYAIACRELDQLLSWKADSNGGIVYLLGSCELARGRNQAAAEAWARVVPGSAFSEQAIRGRLRLLHDSGHLAAAERLITDAAQDCRNDRTSVMALLVPTFREQGRLDEAERLIENRWEHLNARGEGALEPAIKLVRLHIDVTERPIPVETIRAFLDQAARLNADDDRVILGRANLAIRTGANDEARQWLDKCRQLRPDDHAVWVARLRWGMATERIDVVNEALTHIPAGESSSAEFHRWTAWLAAHRGDVATERRELELWAAADPAAVPALDRLAALADKDGQPARAAELRRKKTEIERARARYLSLHDRQQPIRNAVELARLAEQLGRRFEARVFLTIAISENPDRDDLRRDLARLNHASASAF